MRRSNLRDNGLGVYVTFSGGSFSLVWNSVRESHAVITIWAGADLIKKSSVLIRWCTSQVI